MWKLFNVFLGTCCDNSIIFVLKVYCNLQMENNLLYFSLATVVSLATNGVEVREQQNEQSLNNTNDENKADMEAKFLSLKGRL